MATGLPSPIMQVDGETEECVAKFSFESSYHEDDVMYTLEDIFLEPEVDLTLESRMKVGPGRSACEVFVIFLTAKPTSRKRNLSWPKMAQDQAVVFDNIKRIFK